MFEYPPLITLGSASSPFCSCLLLITVSLFSLLRMATLCRQRPYRSPHTPFIRSFNFRLRPSSPRKPYSRDLQYDFDEDYDRTSLNYSQSLLCSTTFNNILMTLCLLAEDKQCPQQDSSTDASSTAKARDKKPKFINHGGVIRRMIEKHSLAQNMGLDNRRISERNFRKIRSFGFRVGKQKLLACTSC